MNDDHQMQKQRRDWKDKILLYTTQCLYRATLGWFGTAEMREREQVAKLALELAKLRGETDPGKHVGDAARLLLTEARDAIIREKERPSRELKEASDAALKWMAEELDKDLLPSRFFTFEWEQNLTQGQHSELQKRLNELAGADVESAAKEVEDWFWWQDSDKLKTTADIDWKSLGNHLMQYDSINTSARERELEKLKAWAVDKALDQVRKGLPAQAKKARRSTYFSQSSPPEGWVPYVRVADLRNLLRKYFGLSPEAPTEKKEEWISEVVAKFEDSIRANQMSIVNLLAIWRFRRAATVAKTQGIIAPAGEA